MQRTFATVLCLLAFVISTRLPPDTEKQMLSIHLSQTLISFSLSRVSALCVCICVGFIHIDTHSMCVCPFDQWCFSVIRV